MTEQAIVYRGKSSFVRVLRDGKSYKVAVTLGRRLKDRFEILSGLDDGAVVIERSTRFLSDGDPVKIQDSAGGEEGSK